MRGCDGNGDGNDHNEDDYDNANSEDDDCDDDDNGSGDGNGGGVGNSDGGATDNIQMKIFIDTNTYSILLLTWRNRRLPSPPQINSSVRLVCLW